MSDRLVLVCDDDDDTLDMMKVILEELPGVRVVTAHDGQEVLTLARSIRPSLVLTDILLPVIDGITVARELKADPNTRGVPVIAVTSWSRIRELAEAAGFAEVVPKPVDVATLQEAVLRRLAMPTG